MPSIFSKNCVCTGEVDSYCLVCSKHLPAEHDVLEHIQETKHKYNLSCNDYFDEHNCVRKVSGVYFCEFCNMMFPTAAKVRLHVTEDTHIDKRRGRMLKRTGKCIVLQENIFITENVWNGLIDDTCVLCNVEFEDESDHKFERNHILNLIKSKVTIGANGNIYRQIDDFCHCLTCNKMVPENMIAEHLDSTQHKNLLTKCDQNQDDYNNDNDKTANKQDSERDGYVTEEPLDTNRILKSLKDFQSSTIDERPLHSNPDLIKEERKSTTSASMSKEVESLAKLHGLSVIKNDNKVYCNACSSAVPARLDNVQEHVTGSKHKSKLTKPDVNKQTSAKLKKVLIKDFVTEMHFIDLRLDVGTSAECITPCVVFNNTFMVNCNKYTGIVKYCGKIICLFCKIDLTPDSVDIHFRSSPHRELIHNCYLITSLENEFVRQLKSDLYDCVYCAHVEHDWDDMLEHLSTDEHKRCKDVHETMLLKHKMSVIQDNLRNAMPFNFFAMLNNMRLF